MTLYTEPNIDPAVQLRNVNYRLPIYAKGMVQYVAETQKFPYGRAASFVVLAWAIRSFWE